MHHSTRLLAALSLLSVASLLGCTELGAPVGDSSRGDAGAAGGDAALPLGDAAMDRDATGPTPADAATGDAASASADAGSHDGAVVELADACDPGTVPGATCRVVSVACGEQAPMAVSLREFPASAGAAPRGTIVLGSGGDGSGFYAARAREFGLIADLNLAGFRVIDRAWQGESGWFGGEGGPGAVACRYATLLRYLRTLHAEGALCATGSSGGSVELIYSLTRNGAGAVLDQALPSSGPFHRLDLACGVAEDAWVAECRALLATNCPTCDASHCGSGAPPEIRSVLEQSFGGRALCASAPSGADAELLRRESPISELAELYFPDTEVDFVLGADDPSGLPPYGMATEAALRAAGTTTALFVEPATGHNVPGSVAGAARLLGLLSAGCVPRH